MMKKNLPILVVLLLLLGCREEVRLLSGYTIDGEIAGLTGKIYLTRFEGKTPYRVDSAEIVNGAFSFSGDCPIPIFSAIETADAPLSRFFLENSPIRIQGEANQPQAIRVAGSQTQELYQTYLRHVDSLESTLSHDSIQRSSTWTTDSLKRQLNLYKVTFVREHPGSVAAAFVLYRESAHWSSATELRKALGAFDPIVRQSVYVQLVDRMASALEKTAVGQPYINLSLPDTIGQPLELSHYVGDGTYVLLDFWASWFPPCAIVNEGLQRLYKTFHARGFEIYAVSLDHSKDTWIASLHKASMPWIQVCDLKAWESPAATLYGVRSIPSNVLIGPDGMILARNLTCDSLRRQLTTYFPMRPKVVLEGEAVPPAQFSDEN